MVSYFIACLPHLSSVVAGGCDWPLPRAYLIMTSLRYVPYVTSVLYFACVALDGNPALVLHEIHTFIYTLVRKFVNTIFIYSIKLCFMSIRQKGRCIILHSAQSG